MAVTIPAIKSKEIHYEYVDGVKIVIKGSDTVATRKAAYLKGSALVITPPIIIIPPVGAREIGNKELSVLRDVENQSFVLKPGIYKDRCDLTNVKNISIDGLGKVQFDTGMRAIQFNGTPPSAVSLNGFNFKNISDYCVDFWKHGDNPSSNPTKGFKFTNMVAENCGTILHIDGDLNRGLVVDLIIKNLSFINSKEPRSVVYAGNAKNYSISNCLVDNINFARNVMENGNVAPNGTHNGVFQMGGWGKFFNNKITNHQGNALRSWLFSQDETGLVEIYNNIVWNSWKYSGFELQNKLGGKPANAKVYNNTVGKMNVSKDWEGQLLDLYETGGSIEFYNNLGFELNRVGKETADMINYNGGSAKMSNNKYFANWQDAVENLTNFKSKINGIGAVQ